MNASAHTKRAPRKRAVNAYLFILAKRLSQYCYFGSKSPTDLEFVKKIYDQYKSRVFGRTKYYDAPTRQIKNGDTITIEEVKLDPLAQSIARRIHKILKTKDLFFTETMLDFLVKEIRFGIDLAKNPPPKFETWIDFVNYFHDDFGVVQSERLCKNRRYDQLATSEKKQIQDAVEYKCILLYTHDPNFGYVHSTVDVKKQLSKRQPTVIANTSSYTIRTMFFGELSDYLYELHEGSTHPVFKKIKNLRGWLEQNHDCVFVYRDPQGIKGYVTLLPLHNAWFANLLVDGKFTKEIDAADIISHAEIHQVDCVLIETIHSLNSRVNNVLTFYLPPMLEVLIKDIDRRFSLIYLSDVSDDTNFIQKYSFSSHTILYGDGINDIKIVYLAKDINITDLLT